MDLAGVMSHLSCETEDEKRMTDKINEEDESDMMMESMTGLEDVELSDTRVAMIGNVDSGKVSFLFPTLFIPSPTTSNFTPRSSTFSNRCLLFHWKLSFTYILFLVCQSTLCGILTRGNLDDGRGSARSFIMKHKHELENGRTSAVAVELVGYTAEGKQVIPSARSGNNVVKRWAEVTEKSARTLTLIDLCGHERYLKTTLFGLTGLLPDFCLLVVGANMGVQVMTREHIGLAVALNIPLFVVLTKIDIAPPNVLKHTRQTLAGILRENGKMPFPVRDEAAVTAAVESIGTNRVTPVFNISAVTGQNVDLLRSFVSKVQRSHSRYTDLHKDPEVDYSAQPTVYFPIDGVYEVKNVGLVVGGTLSHGKIHVGDAIWLGPDTLGHFVQVTIKSIECRRVSKQQVLRGQSATFAIKTVNRKLVLRRSEFRKGMCLADYTPSDSGPAKAPVGFFEFEASVVILHHCTTIGVGSVCSSCRLFPPLPRSSSSPFSSSTTGYNILRLSLLPQIPACHSLRRFASIVGNSRNQGKRQLTDRRARDLSVPILLCTRVSATWRYIPLSGRQSKRNR
jgi:translation elongation factor EF-Tu-like GTPase